MAQDKAYTILRQVLDNTQSVTLLFTYNSPSITLQFEQDSRAFILHRIQRTDPDPPGKINYDQYLAVRGDRKCQKILKTVK